MDTPFRTLKFGLSIEREALYRRIDQRVQAMVEAGLEAEVRSLLAKGYGRSSNPCSPSATATWRPSSPVC